MRSMVTCACSVTAPMLNLQVNVKVASQLYTLNAINAVYALYDIFQVEVLGRYVDTYEVPIKSEPRMLNR